MKVQFSNHAHSSRFVVDPYYPAQVDLGFDSDKPFHLAWIYYGDDNLMQLAYDWHSGELLEIVLTDCEHFVPEQSQIDIPEASEGVIVLSGCKAENHPGYFQTYVHPDGFRVLFSKKQPERFIRSGQVYFGLSADSELLEIRVTNLDPAEAKHVLNTLEEDRIKRGQPLLFPTKE